MNRLSKIGSAVLMLPLVLMLISGCGKQSSSESKTGQTTPSVPVSAARQATNQPTVKQYTETPSAAAASAVQPTAPMPAAALVIHKALYGDLPDGATLDVTDKVRALVKNGVLSVSATADNFGDPFDGRMKLTISKALQRVPGLNLGGENYGANVTEMIKGFQDGNTLMVKSRGDGDSVLTVYYDYGDGRQRLAQTSGSFSIAPPIMLRIDYTFGGIDRSKTAAYGSTLEIHDSGLEETNGLKSFLGEWSGAWGGDGDEPLHITVEEQDGHPRVIIPGRSVYDEKLEGGSLSFSFALNSGREYRYTAAPMSGGLRVVVHRPSDGQDFSGTLYKQ